MVLMAEWTCKQHGTVQIDDRTYCAPCMDKFPHFVELHEKYANDDRLVMIGANFDWKPGEAERAIADQKLTWTQLKLGELGFDRPVPKAYGVSAIPSVWLIGPDGTVLAKDLRGEQVEKAVAEALSNFKGISK